MKKQKEVVFFVQREYGNVFDVYLTLPNRFSKPVHSFRGIWLRETLRKILGEPEK